MKQQLSSKLYTVWLDVLLFALQERRFKPTLVTQDFLTTLNDVIYVITGNCFDYKEICSD